MRIALIPGSFKPYHAGHDTLFRKAAAENDRVIVFYSTADRARPGELAVSGENSTHIMNEYVSRSLPGNVSLVASRVPIRSVFELLSEVDSISNDSYVIYAGSENIAKYSTISKYAPNLANSGRIDLKELVRGEDSPNISGTAMRNFIMIGDVDAFRMGLPPLLRPQAEEIFDLLGGAYKRPLGPSEGLDPSRRHTSRTTSSVRLKTNQTIQENSKKKNKASQRSTRKNKQLLEEFVTSNCLLLEYDEGPTGYDSWSSSPGFLKKAFIAPFMNIVGAAKAGGLDIANIVSIPLRALSAKLGGSDEAFKDAMLGYKSSRNKIEKIWAPVKEFNNKALSGDAQILAFGLAPKAYVASALLKTFKTAIAGKPGNAESGLIGTLSSLGLLPDEWQKSWEDFSSNKEEKEDIQSYDDAREEKLKRKEFKDKLRKLGAVLLPALAALPAYSNVPKKIRDELEEIQDDGKYEKISYEHVEALREFLDNMEEDTKKADKYLTKLDEIDQNRNMYQRYMRATGLRGRRYKNQIKFSNEDLSNVAAGSKEILAANFTALRECLVEYSKTALYAAALFSSKTLEEMQNNLRQHRVKVEKEIKDLNNALEKGVKNGDKSLPKEKLFEISKAAVKAGLGQAVDQRQRQVVDVMRQIESTLETSDAEAKKVLENNPAVKTLRETIDNTKKLMNDVFTQMKAGKIQSGTANKIEEMLRQIDEYTKKIKS